MSDARVKVGDAVKVQLGQRIGTRRDPERNVVRWMRGKVEVVAGDGQVLVRPFSGANGRWFPMRAVRVMDAVEALACVTRRRRSSR